MKKLVTFFAVLTLSMLPGCAGFARGCSSEWADRVGADWIVVQYDMAGAPFRCWRLESVSIANETASDGVYWLGESGNLVHIAGTYNRVQVEGDEWASGFAEVGLTQEGCDALHTRVFDVESGEYR